MAHRVVLDTNIVVSALLFNAGHPAWVRHAWQQQRMQPLVCTANVKELMRVLAYPKFELTKADQEVLLADFLPYSHTVHLPDPWPDLPVCRDEHGQVFLVLAHSGEADSLVTGDADILAMRKSFPRLIVTADEFRERLSQLE